MNPKLDLSISHHVEMREKKNEERLISKILFYSFNNPTINN